MKKIFFILFLLQCWFICFSQSKTTYPLPYDTVRVKKPNGTGYLDASKGRFSDTLEVTTMGDADSSRRVASTAFVKKLMSIGSVVYTDFLNISALRASLLYQNFPSLFINVSGYYTANDGGGGQFYFDASSSATDNNGTIIRPTAISISDPGRYIRINPTPGRYNIRWFGAKGDALTDDRPAFINCYNAADPGIQYPIDPSSTSWIDFPAGTYRMSDSILISKQINLNGTGGGIELYIKSQLKFDAGKKGVIFRNSTAGVRCENLYIRGSYGGDSTTSGFITNAKVDVYNVSVQQFSGNGMEIVTNTSGNSNTNRYEKITLTENTLNGLYVSGGESNAITFSKISANANGRSSIYDISFLGNNYDNIHTSFAGQIQGQKSWVKYGGVFYVSKWPYAQSGIEPTVTAGWENVWQMYVGVDVPSVMFDWNPDTTYFCSSAFALVGPNNYGTVNGLYTESGQGGVILLGYAQMWGGDIGSGMANTSAGWLYMENGKFKSYASMSFQDVNYPTNYLELNRSTGLTIGNTNTGYLQWNAWTDTIARITTAATTDFQTQGFTLPTKSGSFVNRPSLGNKPYMITYRDGMIFMDSTNTNGRFLSAAMSKDSIPVTYHAAGDVVLNIGNDSTIIGWKCITGGTPGTFATWGSGGGGTGAYWPLSGNATLTGNVTMDLGSNVFTLSDVNSSYEFSDGGLDFSVADVAGNSRLLMSPSGFYFKYESDDETVLNSIRINDDGITTELASTKAFTGGATDSTGYVGESYVQRDWVLDHINNKPSGGSPAGSYGNIQINRNSQFASPASDSLNYTTSLGLSLKNNINLVWATSRKIESIFSSSYRQTITFDNTNRNLILEAKTADTGGDIFLRPDGGVGIRTPSSASYNLDVYGSQTANSGILLNNAGGFTNVPNPGTISNAVVLNMRGFNMTNEGVVITGSYIPNLGIGVARSSSSPAVAFKNTGIGGSLVIEQGNVGILTATPTSSLQLVGSFAGNYTATATGITLNATHYVVNVTATGQTITLPAAAGITGRIYTIKLTASGSCTIDANSSETIDGGTTYTLASQYKFATIQSDGTNWIIIGQN